MRVKDVPWWAAVCLSVTVFVALVLILLVAGCGGGEANGATGDTEPPRYSHVHVVKSDRPGGGTVECAVIESELIDVVSVGIDCNW